MTDIPTQKFKRGSKVHICKDMPKNMSHFKSGFDAIVEYSYAQKYGTDDIKKYAVIELSEFGQPIGSNAWYHKDLLTLLDNNIEVGKKIIEDYNYR